MTATNFDSIASIVEYLREPLVPAAKTKPKRLTKSKRNARAVESNSPSTESDDLIQRLPKGRVKYGPITVNPRKEPSKTLFTGRRSKNEVLSGDEEEKRRDRRERNRVAATKCREKRDTVLNRLDQECEDEEAKHEQLTQLVHELQTMKDNLERELSHHSEECFLFNNLPEEYALITNPAMIFGDSTFLSSITENPPLPLPLGDPLLNCSEEEGENTPPVDQGCILTNSAYASDYSTLQLYPQEDMMISLTTSSLEKLMIGLRTPTQSMEMNNNNSNLVNSAQGASCAKQHSGLGDEESLGATHGNQYVC